MGPGDPLKLTLQPCCLSPVGDCKRWPNNSLEVLRYIPVTGGCTPVTGNRFRKLGLANPEGARDCYRRAKRHSCHQAALTLIRNFKHPVLA